MLIGDVELEGMDDFVAEHVILSARLAANGRTMRRLRESVKPPVLSSMRPL